MEDDLPPSDLQRLKDDVLRKPPEAALPCNLSLEWLRLIGRDIDCLFAKGGTSEAGARYLAAPMAIIAHLLCGKAGRPSVTLAVEELMQYCATYRTELGLELMGRLRPMRAEAATMETIFTDREVEFSPAPFEQ